MFFEQTTAVYKYIWTTSAHASNSSIAWSVEGGNGYLGTRNYNNSNEVFPAFSIDLSQIQFTKE